MPGRRAARSPARREPTEYEYACAATPCDDGRVDRRRAAGGAASGMPDADRVPAHITPYVKTSRLVQLPFRTSDQVTGVDGLSDSRTLQYLVTASSTARSACSRSMPAP